MARTLLEDAADILNASVHTAQGKEDKPKKLSQDGEAEIGGPTPSHPADKAQAATHGAPTATPPGATPPVGNEPRHVYPGNQFGNGNSEEGAESLVDGTHSQSGDTGSEHGMQSRVVEADEITEGHNDEEEDKELIKKVVKKDAIKEDVDALLAGQDDLSEEFKTRAETIFEAAVIARVTEAYTILRKQTQQELSDAVAVIREDLENKVNDYMGYVAEQWVADNELAVEAGIRTELTEDFMAGLKKLFAEHYIDIPEDKVDVVEELAAKADELETKLNEEIQRGIDTKKELNEVKKVLIIKESCKELTDVQAAKVYQLAEGTEFTTDEEFATKLEVLKESYFPANKTNVSAELDDAARDAGDPENAKMLAEDNTNHDKVDPEMQSTLAFLDRFKK